MKLLAVDGNSIINRAFYGVKPLTTKNGEFTNAIYGFLNILLKAQEDHSIDNVAIAFDLKAPTFRHKLYDKYKESRKGMPQELATQMPLLKEILGYLGYITVEKEGFEADDILGALAKSCVNSGNTCAILTGDRDSLQLVCDEVYVSLPTTKDGKPESIIYDTQAVIEKYELAPDKLIDVKALMGDSSDNVPGVAGIGEKTAISLIKKFGSLEGVYQNIDSIDISKGVREKLIRDKEMAFLSRTLVTINCDVPINVSIDAYKIGEIDKEKAATLFNRLEMASFIKRFNLTEIKTQTKPAEINNISNISFKLNKDYDIHNFYEEISKNGEIIFTYSIENNLLYKLYIALNEEIIVLEHDRMDIFYKILKDDTIKKITFDTKTLYHAFLNGNIDYDSFYFDILLAAYLLNPAASGYELNRLTGEYPSNIVANENIDDENAKNAVIVFGLYPILKEQIKEQGMENLLNDIELPLAVVLSQMEHTGVLLDAVGLREFGNKLEARLFELVGQIYYEVGYEFNINSPKQLGEALFTKLDLPFGKKTKTGHSTNVEVLENLRGVHPVIELILEYRQLAKLKSTYVEGLLKVVSSDSRIHTSFRQTETKTGRISSIEPNLQNIPVRTELGSQMRRFFVAGEGNILIDADYSQIELRVLAAIANDKNMIDAFLSGEDIHTTTAAQVFDLNKSDITPIMRSRAKAVNFGIVYGIGAFSLSKDIGVTVAEASRYIKNYLEKFSGVHTYMDSTIKKAKEDGFVTTYFGRRRNIPELKMANKVTQAFGERIALNTPIQGTAADIIKIAMVLVFKRIKREGLKANLILQIHDELIIEAPIDEAEKMKEILTFEMENAVKLTVAMEAEAKSGKSWYDAKA